MRSDVMGGGQVVGGCVLSSAVFLFPVRRCATSGAPQYSRQYSWPRDSRPSRLALVSFLTPFLQEVLRRLAVGSSRIIAQHGASKEGSELL